MHSLSGASESAVQSMFNGRSSRALLSLLVLVFCFVQVFNRSCDVAGIKAVATVEADEHAKLAQGHRALEPACGKPPLHQNM